MLSQENLRTLRNKFGLLATGDIDCKLARRTEADLKQSAAYLCGCGGILTADAHRLTCLIYLQAIGNIATVFPEYRIVILNDVANHIFGFVSQVTDEKVLHIVCMIFANCFRCSEDDIASSISSDFRWNDLYRVLIQSMDLCDDLWPCLVAKRLLTKFFCFSKILSVQEPKYRASIFSLCHQMMLSGNLRTPTHCVSFVCEHFCLKASEIEKLKPDDETCDHEELIALLNLLCYWSADVAYLTELQPVESVLMTALVLLKEAVKNPDKIANNCSNPQEGTQKSDLVADCEEAMVTQRRETSGIPGYKRSLVSLIGNICYKNNSGKETVREMGGLLDILNCTPLDDKNPFISQWAIWAIRNICEDCAENQKIIKDVLGSGVTGIRASELLGQDTKIIEEEGCFRLTKNR